MNIKFLVALSVGTLLNVSAFAMSPIPTLDLSETSKNIESVEELKSYYNGGARIFLHDNEEPAASPMEVTIVVPNGDSEQGYIDLKTLSAGNFCEVSLSKSKSSYNEKHGLLVQIPVVRYNHETSRCTLKDTLNINIKMKSGYKSDVVAWLKSGSRN